MFPVFCRLLRERMKTMAKIIGIGDAKMDKNCTDMIAYPGGQAMNVAVNAKLQGADAAFIGCIGDDKLGLHLAAVLDEIGMDRSHARIVHGENAATKYRVIDGERVWGGSSPKKAISPLQMGIRWMLNYYGLSDEDMEYIAGFDAAHLCNTAHMDEYLPKIKESGVIISYDYSSDHLKEGFMEQVAPYIDISLMSGSRMTGTEKMEALVRAHTLGTKIAIITNGEEGAILYDGNRFYWQQPDLKDAVDTMGAGDAFVSAFIVAFVDLKGFEAETTEEREERIYKALDAAAKWSAVSTQVNGAFGHGCPIVSED